MLTLYTSGVYQDWIWLVGITTDRVWPYIVHRGEAYAALYPPFTLTLDGITVTSVLSHSTQLSTIQSMADTKVVQKSA